MLKKKKKMYLLLDLKNWQQFGATDGRQRAKRRVDRSQKWDRRRHSPVCPARLLGRVARQQKPLGI